MSINIPAHYAQQFSTNIELLLQQKGSKLRNMVMTGSHVGEQASPVDQFGAVEAQEVTTRFGDMPRIDAPADRRWVYPSDYDLPQLIDTKDKLRLITDPTSSYVRNAVYGMGRKMDDVVIDSFFGTAKTGKQGATSTTFPAAQVVAVNEGAASNTGLTVAKLLATREILMGNEVDMDEDPICAVITAKQNSDLLKEVQITSQDFNSKPVMVDGKIQYFLGIQFIHCERLDADSNSYRRVPIFAKSGMYLGLWQDIMTDVSQRKDLQSIPWQVYAKGTFGATRLEEEKVVEVKCAE